MDIRIPASSHVTVHATNPETCLVRLPIDFIVGKQEFRHMTRISGVRFVSNGSQLTAGRVILLERGAELQPGEDGPPKGIRWPVTIAAEAASGLDPLDLLIPISCSSEEFRNSPTWTLNLVLEFDHGKEIPLTLQLAWRAGELVLESLSRSSSPRRLATALTILTLTYIYVTFWNDLINSGASSGMFSPKLVQGLLYSASGYVGFAAIRRAFVSAPGLFSFFEYPELEVHHRLAGLIGRKSVTLAIYLGCFAVFLSTLYLWTFALPVDFSSNLVVVPYSESAPLPTENTRVRRTELPSSVFCNTSQVSETRPETKRLGYLDQFGEYRAEPFYLEVGNKWQELLEASCTQVGDVQADIADGLTLVKFEADVDFGLKCVPETARPAVRSFLCGGSGEAGNFQVVERRPRRLRLYKAQQITGSDLTTALAAWEDEIEMRNLGVHQILQEFERYTGMLPNFLPKDEVVSPDHLVDLYESSSIATGNPADSARRVLRVAALVPVTLLTEGTAVPTRNIRSWTEAFRALVNQEAKISNSFRVKNRLWIRLFLEIEKSLAKRGLTEVAEDVRRSIEETLVALNDSRLLLSYLEDCFRSGAFRLESWKQGAIARRDFFTENSNLLDQIPVGVARALQRAANTLSEREAEVLKRIAEDVEKQRTAVSSALSTNWYQIGVWRHGPEQAVSNPTSEPSDHRDQEAETARS